MQTYFTSRACLDCIVCASSKSTVLYIVLPHLSLLRIKEIKMKTLVLLTCVWLVTLGVVQCSQMPDMHMFSASDGAQCELFELDRTDSMTMIGVNCHCQDERGHEQVCRWLNKCVCY